MKIQRSPHFINFIDNWFRCSLTSVAIVIAKNNPRMTWISNVARACANKCQAFDLHFCASECVCVCVIRGQLVIFPLICSFYCFFCLFFSFRLDVRQYLIIITISTQILQNVPKPKPTTQSRYDCDCDLRVFNLRRESCARLHYIDIVPDTQSTTELIPNKGQNDFLPVSPLYRCCLKQSDSSSIGTNFMQ